MAQGVGVEEIIDIQTEVQSGGTLQAEFGTGLLITESNKMPAGGSNKCLRFPTLAAVAELFGDDSTYDDAAVWFAADPAPKALYIGRWARQAVNTTLNGARVTATIGTVAQADASYRVNGVNRTVNLSSASTFTALATALQTSLQGVTGLSSAEVTWNSNLSRMQIDYESTADIGPFETTTANTVGTDIADLLRLKVTPNARATSATYLQGSAVETLSQGVSRCVALAVGGAPTAIMLQSDVPSSNLDDLETIVQGGDFMTARLDTAAVALTADDETSALYDTFTNSRSHVIPVYSRGGEGGDAAPRPDIAIMAKLSSQNFDLPQSIITLVPKTLPGVGTTDVNSTQLAALAAKQASVYTQVGGLPSLLGGWTGKSGVFADAQWWLLWLKNEMERSIFEAMRTSKRLSHAQLKDTINGVMGKAVNSGGAKPGGVVSDVIKHDIRRVTGNYEFDGIMNTGYVLWIDPPALQTPADRAARISRFKVWIAPSEAIHSVGGGIILSG